jgi:uncharacterized protein YbcC (UPF0753/DUF2309 family)
MEAVNSATDLRGRVRAAIHHFEHLLPAQAPLRDFVHHNTLHGFQHLHFRRAVAEAGRLLGNRGYLPLERFRTMIASGRVSVDDLLQQIDSDSQLAADEPVSGLEPLARRDICLVALTHPLPTLTLCQLRWAFEGEGAGERFQSDVPLERRRQLLSSAGCSEGEAIAALWREVLDRLGLDHWVAHPEELVELTPEEAESLVSELGSDRSPDRESDGDLLASEAEIELERLLERIGDELTLRGMLVELTGRDILEELRPLLQRQIAHYLDQGVAAWSEEQAPGFYALWRRNAYRDPGWALGGIADWEEHVDSLSDDPVDAIIAELQRMGLPEAKWGGYLERLALELPGWSGMFYWRHQNPGYEGLIPERVEMVDYLAVRLVLEQLHARQLTRELWNVEASIDILRWHLRHHQAEFLVRHTLFTRRLPEYLTHAAQRLAQHRYQDHPGIPAWERLASHLLAWRRSPVSATAGCYTVNESGWQLFRLCQLLGLSANRLQQLDEVGVETIFDTVAAIDAERAGWLWLQAYETHYRDQVLAALMANHGRHPTAPRSCSAQLVFCMDDREEGFRRHLEEIDPTVETLGAAAHFGVFNYWRGLDDDRVTPLCPVVARPEHEFREQPLSGKELAAWQRREWLQRLDRWQASLVHTTRHRPLAGLMLTFAVAPFALVDLFGKLFAHTKVASLVSALEQRHYPKPQTRVAITASDDGTTPSPERPRLGYTHDEQLTRAEAVLRNIGLVDRFAPLVVIMAHGSSSQNNPHLAAYDCGACSGRHSGPNARLLATIVNRPEIRAGLAGRGVVIPDGCHFVAAEHNTCTEEIEWYDIDLVPPALREGFSHLRRTLQEASRRHAHERCRRLASAPHDGDHDRALDHIRGRAADITQPRPELGHATNAAAVIGRRALTRGAFFDRRVFLISYDPTTDPDGSVLERLLLANGPVGAGINLEYYFSTVDNEGYGCGSKVTHNITGMFGVMQGTSSDLRTGLPRQMVEIHEAMRLQVIVESTIDQVTAIYLRQPPLQELVGNGWLLLSVIDRDSGAIHTFDPEHGFSEWGGGEQIQVAKTTGSQAWYQGFSGPLPPALIGVSGEER